MQDVKRQRQKRKQRQRKRQNKKRGGNTALFFNKNIMVL